MDTISDFLRLALAENNIRRGKWTANPEHTRGDFSEAFLVAHLIDQSVATGHNHGPPTREMEAVYLACEMMLVTWSDHTSDVDCYTPYFSANSIKDTRWETGSIWVELPTMGRTGGDGMGVIWAIVCNAESSKCTC